MNGWNRCNVCGKFIALDDFVGDPPKAVNRLVNPSAYGTEEVWDTYHVACATHLLPPVREALAEDKT